jgi:hypothetical protein
MELIELCILNREDRKDRKEKIYESRQWHSSDGNAQ